MKTKHLKKRSRYFKALGGLDKSEIKNYLRQCPDTLIHVICEACFNLCHHHALKEDERLCREIDPLNIYIKKLINKKVDVQYKRDILQKIGAEIVSLIYSNVLPLLKEYTKNEQIVNV